MPAICLGWSLDMNPYDLIMNSLTPPPKMTSQSEFSCQKPEWWSQNHALHPKYQLYINYVYIYINYVHSKGWEVRWLFFCRLPFGSKPTKALRQRPLVTGVVLCHKGWWWSWFNAWNITLCGNAMWTALGGCCCWVVWVGCVGKMWNNQKSGSDKLE